MSAVSRQRLFLGLSILAILGFCASAARADEIRLKDGKKLYGVIVGYEDNMFKVKTDYRLCPRGKRQDRLHYSRFARTACSRKNRPSSETGRSQVDAKSNASQNRRKKKKQPPS